MPTSVQSDHLTSSPIRESLLEAFSSIPARPSDSHKLDLLFPVKSKIPEFVWIPYRDTIVKSKQFSVPQVNPFLTNGARDSFTAEQFLIEKANIERAKNVDYSLAVYMRDKFMSDGSSQRKLRNHLSEQNRGIRGVDLFLSLRCKELPSLKPPN